MATPNLTFSEAFIFFRYDPDTGVIYWREQPPNTKKVAAGAVAGSPTTTGYWRVCFRGRQHLAHRLAWLLSHGDWPAHQVDHMNGNRLDNRLANLRDATHHVNQQNRRTSKNTAGLLGVSPNGSKWAARIKVGGVLRHLGMFNSADAAHLAYVVAKRSLHPGGTL